MQKPAKYASLMATLDNGTAIVLPAYETGDAGDIGVEVAREAVLGELGVAGAPEACVWVLAAWVCVRRQIAACPA